jgi:hypothetical protein
MLKKFQYKQFYYVVSGLKILGHLNSDNNLESHCSFDTGYKRAEESCTKTTSSQSSVSSLVVAL